MLPGQQCRINVVDHLSHVKWQRFGLHYRLNRVRRRRHRRAGSAKSVLRTSLVFRTARSIAFSFSLDQITLVVWATHIGGACIIV